MDIKSLNQLQLQFFFNLVLYLFSFSLKGTVFENYLLGKNSSVLIFVTYPKFCYFQSAKVLARSVTFNQKIIHLKPLKILKNVFLEEFR